MSFPERVKIVEVGPRDGLQNEAITVPTQTTLTLDPGVAFKLWRGQSLDVDGRLLAQGTATNPIVFTSRSDDTVMGDTFHDGETESRAGDWRQIRFDASGSGQRIDFVTVLE